MPYNGAGQFTRVYSWVADKNAGLDISSSRMDTDSNDIATNGLGLALTRDGQGFATANLPMATFRHTGVGDGVGLTDYASLKQAQNGTVSWTVAGGTADALTAAYTPAHTALVDGLLCAVRAVNANATTTPTFAPDGLTAHTITKLGGAGLTAGDIAGNLVEIILRYNLSNTRWELLNPQAPAKYTGEIFVFAGASAPAGSVLCDGTSYLRAGAMAALFAVIGTTYGSADGTHFNVPDLQGRVIAGVGGSRITVAGGNFDGTVLGNTNSGGLGQNKTIAQANLPNVSFTNSGIALNDPGHFHDAQAQSGGTNPSGNPVGNYPGGSLTTWSTSHNGVMHGAGDPFVMSNTTGITVSAQGSAASGGAGTALSVVQPTMVMTMCIKT